MRIGRTLPPAAAPIYLREIFNGLRGLTRGQREIERFTAEVKAYFGVRHCFVVSSGKAALTIILRALQALHPERDEVIMPAFACYSVPSAIVRAGLKIRLCDIDLDTLDFDYNQLERIFQESSRKKTNNNCFDSSDKLNTRLTARNSGSPMKPTKHISSLLAIIPIHLFGLTTNIQRLKSLVFDSKIVIVEDGAQVMGGEWNGKKLGTLGDVGFFSLGRGKAISTTEGGVIISDNPNIAEKVNDQLTNIKGYTISKLTRLLIDSVLLSIFTRPYFFWFPKLLPFLKVGDTIFDPDFAISKMSAFQAGLAKNWEIKLRSFTKKRSKNSTFWSANTKQSCYHKYINSNRRISNFIRYPVRIDDRPIREKILGLSEQKGFGIMSTYPSSVNGIGALQSNFQNQYFPNAERASRSLITLPVHPLVSMKDKEIIKTFL